MTKITTLNRDNLTGLRDNPYNRGLCYKQLVRLSALCIASAGHLWIQSMLKTVGIQVLATLVAAFIAFFWSDAAFIMSMLAGGAAAAIPNGLFALRLAAHRNKSVESYPVVFFLGEFAKIGLTIAALAVAYKWMPNVSGAGLLLGFVVALKAPMVVFFLSFISERKNGLQY
jgi:ATP synthase protein I